LDNERGCWLAPWTDKTCQNAAENGEKRREASEIDAIWLLGS